LQVDEIIRPLLENLLARSPEFRFPSKKDASEGLGGIDQLRFDLMALDRPRR
jgi:hypothetical protein